MIERNLCKCGCGGEAKVGNSFIKGHNRRGLVSFTSNGRWSIGYDCCRECGTIDRKHNRDGYCAACARRLKYSGKLQLKRDLIGGRWSRKYDCCQDCGTVQRPHQSSGLCGNCWQALRRRRLGVRKRIVGRWSMGFDCCKKCGTAEVEHNAKGLCNACYDETIREEKFDCEFEVCPICDIKTVKLQQHVSMRAKKCIRHLELYNKFYNDIVSTFSTEKTSGQVSKELNITKRRVLNIWHENFTDTEIKDRGEKIRVSKISGENNYLFGKQPPLVSNNLIKFIDRNDRFYIMRSTWEVKYAQYLDANSIDWEYEKHKFKYYDNNGGPHYYFPDFYLPAKKKFIEVKGYMDDKSKFKIEECIKQHGIRIDILFKDDLKLLGLDI